MKKQIALVILRCLMESRENSIHEIPDLAQSIIDMVVENIKSLEVNYFLDAQEFIKKDKIINLLKEE